MNLTELANYFVLHPEPAERMELENEDDNEPRPYHAPCTDSSLIHGLRRSYARRSGVMAAMPISSYATDSFETVFDPGTAIPPDTHGAVDSNYCMTTINTTVEIQTRAGVLAIPTVTLNQFFSPVSPANSTFDPRVHYDPYTNRWMVICVDGANNTADSSSILIAISKTSNPTGAWWMYKVRTYTPHTYWLDFPDVGFNSKWITVTGNLFQNEPGTGYNGAKVFVFNKASLLSGAGAPFTSFTQASSFTICPALTYDPNEINLFAVETWDGTATGGGQMQLWKISGAVGSEAMNSLGFIASTGFNWQNTSYAITGGTTADSDFAPQLGSTYLVRCNDDRLDQMVLMNSKLWFAHTVFLPYSTTVDPSRCSIQWFQTDTFGNPLQIGLIDDPTTGHFFAFPSLTVNTSDDALVGFGDFAATIHPSAAYAMHMSTDPADSMRGVQIYRHGQSAYYKTYGGQTSRWGDYSGTALDPVNQTDFWTVQEVSSSTANDWDTWWAYVKLCSPPAAISGTLSVCNGSSTTLTDDTTGGTWSSGNTGVATIGSLTGLVNSIASGTSIITYTIDGGCTVTATVEVNPVPFGISGTLNICEGQSVTLSDPTAGGTWASSNTSIASIGSTTGTITGLLQGTTMVTYAMPTGCFTASLFTVNLTPGGITGAPSICAGGSTTLYDATSGGTWSSGNVTVGIVGSGTGILSGLSSGTVSITYSLGLGCIASTIETVTISPTAIIGTFAICASQSTTLTDGIAGGTWYSDNPAVAAIGSSSGTVTGMTGGTAVITYTLNDGCSITSTETVNTTPLSISGPANVCVGASIGLSDVSTGGTWSSSNTDATIGSISGTVNGVATGTSMITYTLPGNCIATDIITVNPSPGLITGAAMLCVGYTTTLTDPTPGGTWTSGSVANATVGSTSGTVTGVLAGTSMITYDLGAGCITTTVITVNSVPTSITGTTTFCSNSSTTLFDGVSGGAWSSSDVAIAAAGTGGAITGVSSGTAFISYSLGAGCYAVTTVTLLSSPSAIAGMFSLCVAGSTTLTDGISGGAWTSSNTSVITIGSASGYATGTAIGTSMVTYALGDGCNTNVLMTVVPATTAPITGSSTVCLGQSTTLSDATSGGTWTSSNLLVATVGSSGVVSGASLGSVTITYTVVTACGTARATHPMTVNAVPSVLPITSSSTTLCTGATLMLSDATPSGVWSSGNTILATVGSISGIVSGASAGVVPMSYSVTNVAGCTTSAIINISVTSPLAAIITPSGPTSFCTGGSVLLNATAGTGLLYQWMLGGVDIAGATNSGFTTGTGGVYTVAINSGSSCISISAPVTITVNPLPIVVPSDNITAVPGTILCLTTAPVTFSASSVHGGTTPAYQWSVNGTTVASGTSYSYSPANGDVVRCLLTSSDACAFPDTAVTSVTMTISPLENPEVGINASPGTILCIGEAVTLSAMPVYGGIAPTYMWNKNGTNLATGPSYTLTPANGDIVKCTMTSDYPCLNTTVAVSAPVTLTVTAPDTNTVNITVSQSIIGAGATDTFTAAAPYGGSSPAYQWYINGTAVTGATSAVYVTNSLADGDVVTCGVMSNDPCAIPHDAFSGGISVHVGAAGLTNLTAGGGFEIIPNPNNGTFTLTGTLPYSGDTKVGIRVTDLPGHVVYVEQAKANNGVVSDIITLPASLANGVYLLSVTAGANHVMFHVVVEK